ncbi:unnamed protein product [Candida verbasci]|uniref:Dienelactone hydrolase domain-containing protein n=1 Tax=Candida verbasci TaxID=1227364 RepID=A0A9W4XMH5_9ASCO|nr:unnamed protein product [Candida verbasci]
MASNPPGACCVQGTYHEGDAIGKHQDLFGLETYLVGEEQNDKIIVILTDIYGHHFKNVLLIADEISKKGYKVLVPDILNGDPVKSFDELQDWLVHHGPETTSPIVDSFLQKVKTELKPKFLGGIGYCFGAKYAVQNLSTQGYLDAAAIAHPSFITIDEVKKITKPIIISAAEIDPIFTTELRHKTEAELAKLKNVRYQIDLFHGVAHGYAVRGDIKEPLVRYSKEKTLIDQLYFFDSVSNLSKL